MLKIFHVLDKIKPVYDIVEKIMMFICKLLLIGDILITSWAVAANASNDTIHIKNTLFKLFILFSY